MNAHPYPKKRYTEGELIVEVEVIRDESNVVREYYMLRVTRIIRPDPGWPLRVGSEFVSRQLRGGKKFFVMDDIVPAPAGEAKAKAE